MHTHTLWKAFKQPVLASLHANAYNAHPRILAHSVTHDKSGIQRGNALHMDILSPKVFTVNTYKLLNTNSDGNGGEAYNIGSDSIRYCNSKAFGNCVIAQQ